jgi:predicted Zn-dependent protease
MIKKTILQALLISAVFFLLWFGFSQIDFMSHFEVKEKTERLESKIGDMIWDELQETEDVITNDSILKALDSFVKPLCDANDIDQDSLKIHILLKDEVNAFALPNNHLVIYSGLIQDCKQTEALQGVLGHEIAHIEKNHVMKKLSKEIGYSVLLAAAGGSKTGEVTRQIFKTLSSTAYDRKLEKEADITSVNYMIKAKIDPKPMADFMYQMAQDNQSEKYMEWISDHPDSEERAKYILEYIKGKKLKSNNTDQKKWEAFQKKIREQ